MLLYSVNKQWFHIHTNYMYMYGILEEYTVATRWDQQCVK